MTARLVAVIDTGVKPGPRLPNVDPGGDFVEATDGLTDCDGHGTLVAGLIAGQPGADGVSGVAPNARIIAIRQTSSRFAPRSSGEDPAVTQAILEVATLARAVVRAADLGARVITVSAVTCVPANRNIDQSELGAALRYAAVEKDAVIVAAAGDTGSRRLRIQPAHRSGPAGRSTELGERTSVSIPSWWQPYVLSVGSLTTGGGPSRFSMAGPWVGIAAPGENITSVSNDAAGGLANGMPNDEQGLSPISGTELRRRLRIRSCGIGTQSVSRTERRAGREAPHGNRPHRGPITVEPRRRRKRRSCRGAHLAGVRRAPTSIRPP